MNKPSWWRVPQHISLFSSCHQDANMAVGGAGMIGRRPKGYMTWKEQNNSVAPSGAGRVLEQQMFHYHDWILKKVEDELMFSRRN